MIALDTFNKILEENGDRLPLLALDEFFEGNTQEDSIAPNQYGYGRPPISEIWALARTLENLPSVAWVRVELHDDTEIAELDGQGVLVLAGESIVVCTSLPAPELEIAAKCEWLCSGGVEKWKPSEMDRVFSRIPPVPEGFQCFAIVWD